VTSQPVLVVEHEQQCPPGWVGEWLVEAGCSVDVRRPHRGDHLPEDLSGHRSMVVLGGSMNAYAEADHPWLGRVKALVRAAVADLTPVLGICLGHQLVAVALGGAVHTNPRGQQIGVLAPGWLPEAFEDGLFSSVAGAAVSVQWNNDVVSVLPPDAVVLARTPHGEVQAARFAPTVWGVQSHPEAGEEIVRAWAENDRDDALERGVDVDSYLRDVAAAREDLRRSWQPLAAGFAQLTRDVVTAW
jgi:GMP synthase (glutamine-hydrolysing)